MALPVLPLLAAGLLGHAGYRAARTAVDAAGRDRRRRDWPVVQDPEAAAAAFTSGGGGGKGFVPGVPAMTWHLRIPHTPFRADKERSSYL